MSQGPTTVALPAIANVRPSSTSFRCTTSIPPSPPSAHANRHRHSRATAQMLPRWDIVGRVGAGGPGWVGGKGRGGWVGGKGRDGEVDRLDCCAPSLHLLLLVVVLAVLAP
ncbi:unnamed protein product [Lampetra planeri]